jgi:Domain of unknown function (DUF4184)
MSVPFTPSHVAAILPIAWWARPPLPFAALAAGAMSPDLPYFLPGALSPPLNTPWTHEPSGLVTWDLLYGVLMWAAWRLIAPSLWEVAPPPIRERWDPASGAHVRWWAVPVAVVIGATTHVVWDAFTHHDRFGARQIELLTDVHAGPLGTWDGARYLQYLSSVVGLVVIVVLGLRRPRLPVPPTRHPGLARWTPMLVLLGAAMGLAVRWTQVDVATLTRREGTFLVLTSAMSGAAAAVLGVCAVCLATASRARARGT